MNVMMKCGHAAQGHDGQGRPVCVICIVISAGADVIDDSPPSLEGRESVCGSCRGSGKGRYTGTVPARAPSDASLPFFEHRPKDATDRHYCGGMGWD